MKLRLAAALGAMGFVLASASPAAAGAMLRDIDVGKYPVVSMAMLVDGPAPALSNFHLRENGHVVEHFDVTPLAKTGTSVGTVLVIDTSGSMAEAGKLDAAKAAAAKFVAEKGATDLIAVVAFGDTSRVVVDFTPDASALTQGIDSLKPAGETALWEAVGVGARLFAKRPGLQANILVLTDGKNSVPGVTLEQARDAASAAHAFVFVVGLGDANADAAALTALANPTGGRFVAATDGKVLATIYDGISQTLRNQYRISYTSRATGNVALDLTAGEAHATATFNSPPQPAAEPSVSPSTPQHPRSLLRGTSGRLVAGGLVFIAVTLLLLAVAKFVIPDGPSMASMILPYGDPGDALPDGPRRVQLAETTLLKRAVEATAKVGHERGFLSSIERTLEQANAPIRAAEAFFFANAVVAISAILIFVTLRSLVATLVTLAVGALAPAAWLKLRIVRRKRRFLAQLPDTLQLLAGSLRAGYSLMQGVETVAHEIRDPMGKELGIVLAETRLGRSLEDALEDAGQRMGSPDFDWAIMAINIQREVGGNLAELLSTVAETMIARGRLRREVKALTAEGRMTAIILGLLPLVIGMALYVLNPAYMQVMFNRSIGKIVLAGSTLWAVLGFFWMKKIITVDA